MSVIRQCDPLDLDVSMLSQRAHALRRPSGRRGRRLRVTRASTWIVYALIIATSVMALVDLVLLSSVVPK